MTSGGAWRIITGHKRPGEPLQVHTGAGEISLSAAAPAPTQPQPHHGGTMSITPHIPSQPLYRFEARFGAADSEPIVSCTGPAVVAANAARNWADVIDPFKPDPAIDLRYIGWLEWLSKLLPFLRRR